MEVFLKKYSWVAYLALLFLGTFFLAKMTAGVIASKLRIEKKISVPKVALVDTTKKKRTSFEDYRIILDRNIFDSRDLAPEEVETEVAQAPANLDGPAVKTTLPIKLISTVSVGDGTDKRSSATVSSGRGKEETYSIGDEDQFSQGVELKKILPDRIEFVHNRRLEYAEIENFGEGLVTSQSISALEKGTPSAKDRPKKPSGRESSGIKEVEDGRYVVERAELDNALGSLDKLFTQIRAVPQFKDGKTSGLKLLSVKQGSLFAKLGLRRNDVLERINGQQVDMKGGMALFGKLKDSQQISIDLVRNGKNTTLEYEIQ